jgi:hypothetical protein
MRENVTEREHLVLPVYLNEKVVLDMLAILQDGFSMVSEISTTSQESNDVSGTTKGEMSSGSFLKIKLGAEVSGEKKQEEQWVSKEARFHTSASLFSEFRRQLIEHDMLTCMASDSLDIHEIQIGDFIEVEGALMKNPLIDILEKFISVYRMSKIFSEPVAVGHKKQASQKELAEDAQIQQMRALLEELRVTGTLDFVLKSDRASLVLSAQEKYLENDNISELIGGNFKILGKVIKICAEKDEGISLVRKTPLDILDADSLDGLIQAFESNDLKQLHLPEVEIQISAPAAIVIPVAIYV